MKKKKITNNFRFTLSSGLSMVTLERLEIIAKQITAHEANMAYLQAVFEGRIDLSKTGCTSAIRRYQPTREDKARFPKTIENLQQQICLFKHEREVLKKYGR
jgi:hypothetical protein